MNAESRVAALRQRLADETKRSILISQPANIAYLTGFEGVFDGERAHAVVITADSQRIYTDHRYSQAMSTASVGTGWDVRVPSQDLYATLCADLASDGVDEMLIEESVPYGRFRFISREFAGNIEAVDHWVEELRQTKNAEEIRRITAAQALTDDAFDHILGVIAPGMTERQIALEIEFFMRRAGSDGVAFSPIVASGPNSALPHAKVTDRVVSAGDFLKMDFGARVDGYCADMTRTVVVGTADDHQRDVYGAVLSANLAGIAAVRAGVPGSEIDAAARQVLSGAGFGELFTHGVGHGVGMDVHEMPVVNPRGKKGVTEGSVITIEPGVYEAGVGGVRIEDLVVVEEGRGRVLTRSTKELIEL